MTWFYLTNRPSKKNKSKHSVFSKIYIKFSFLKIDPPYLAYLRDDVSGCLRLDGGLGWNPQWYCKLRIFLLFANFSPEILWIFIQYILWIRWYKCIYKLLIRGVNSLDNHCAIAIYIFFAKNMFKFPDIFCRYIYELII